VIVLGVDPGITHLGLGVVEAEEKGALKARLLHGEVVRTSHKEKAEARVGRIHARAKEALLAFRPEALAVEEQFFLPPKRAGLQGGLGPGGGLGGGL
jgi:crossover junction endodeoxyribonuclease RuvC